MKKFYVALFFTVFSFGFVTLLPSERASALDGSAFQAGRIMDDNIFFNGSSMDTGTIQAFLNSKVPTCDTWGSKPYGGTTRAAYGASRGYPAPYTCLRDFSQDTPTKPGEPGLCNTYGGGVKPAAQIIRDVANDCGISPKVLIVLLEKEQSLITDDWPWSIQYRSATGYGCPDTAPCDAEYYGFFNQVYMAARQYKRYARDVNSYGYRPYRNNYIQYNPNAACGGTNVYIQNQATAGLYNYTPYQPNPSALANLYGTGDGCGAYGNRNFWRIYSEWFGPTLGYYCDVRPPSPVKSGVTFGKLSAWANNTPNLLIYDGSSTNCVEFHAWNPGYSSWGYNVASNQVSVNPSNSLIRYGDLNGDGRDEPVLIGLNGTGSGRVEFHVWNNDLRSWNQNVASNLPALADPSAFDIQIADTNGDGRDEPVLIGLNGTGSGRVEFHVWNNDLRSWRRQTPSNQIVVNPSVSAVRFGDLNGDNVDEPVLIGLNGTGSGRVEFHIWNTWMNVWTDHIASNQPVIDPSNSNIELADQDGDRRDEAVLIGLRYTGSGRVEFHTWHLGMQYWRQHIASNQPVLQ